jgi:hypothetical protein
MATVKTFEVGRTLALQIASGSEILYGNSFFKNVQLLKR